MNDPDDRLFTRQRINMVREQIERRGIEDERVLSSMRKVPRHLFVPEELRHLSYEDSALPLGPGQTISQPYIVAYMMEKLDLMPGDKVLEVGTGSGYQAALLRELVQNVYSIEIDPNLTAAAQATLNALGYDDVHLAVGDGSLGWPEAAPFNKIMLTAASLEVSRELIAELADDGRMILPLGDMHQALVLFWKEGGVLKSEECCAVSFVKMR